MRGLNEKSRAFSKPARRDCRSFAQVRIADKTPDKFPARENFRSAQVRQKIPARRYPICGHIKNRFGKVITRRDDGRYSRGGGKTVAALYERRIKIDRRCQNPA